MASEAIKPSNPPPPPPPRSLVFHVSRMNASEKRQLRKKLEIELAQVRSTMKRLQECAEISKMITDSSTATTIVVPLHSVKNDQSCCSLGLEENQRRIIVENSAGIKTCPKKKMLNSDVGVSTSLPKKGTTRILGYVDNTTEIKSSSKKVVRSCSIEEPKLGKCSSSVIKSTPESMVTHATTDQGFPQGFLKGQDKKKKQTTDKCRVIEDPEVNSYLNSASTGSCKRPINLLGGAETKIKPGQRGYFESRVKSYYSGQKSSSVPSKRGAPTDEFVVSGADDCRLFHLPKKQKLESKSILDDSTNGKNKLCPSSAKPSMHDLIEIAIQKRKEAAESKRREDSIQQPCMISKTEVIAAVEVAPCQSSKISSKMQLEMKRQAARIALEKVVKPVDIYESPDIINEVEWLARACMKINPLKRLGLTLTDCRRISC